LFSVRHVLGAVLVLISIASADTQLPNCIDVQTLVTKIRTIRSLDWTKINKDRLQNLFDKKLENVFCGDPNNPDSCNALNLNEKIGDCVCNLTFAFDQNSNGSDLRWIFIAYPVKDWTTAMWTSRDLVLSLAPVVSGTGFDPSVGWDIQEAENFERTFSWKGRVEEKIGNTLRVEEQNSVQLNVESCGKDFWNIRMYICCRPIN
jgi:hypothetical protein